LDSSEARQFVQEEIQALWQNWKPSEGEIEVWLNALADYDWLEAKCAIQTYYAEGGSRSRRPVVNKVRAAMRRPKSSSGAYDDLKTDTYIKCISHEQKPCLVGRCVPVFVDPPKLHGDLDNRKRAGHLLAEKHAQVYGGHWIVIDKPEGPTIDDGLRGDDARWEAEAQILSGPDSPGKRFLQRLRSGKDAPVLKTVDEAIRPTNTNGERGRQLQKLVEANVPGKGDDDIPF